MSDDEMQIRALVQTWLDATRDGNIDVVMDLMTDDAVFLIPGLDPMSRQAFEAHARAQAAPGGMRISGQADIQEVCIDGDLAYAWNKLSIKVTPAGAPTLSRSGHVLSVFRKVNGRWRLHRDANLLA